VERLEGHGCKRYALWGAVVMPKSVVGVFMDLIKSLYPIDHSSQQGLIAAKVIFKLIF